MKIFATIEYVSARRAVVDYTDEHGAWLGATRIEVPRAEAGRAGLYEAGFRAAEARAAERGARLERYRALKK